MLKQLQAAQNKSLSIKKTLSKLIAENNELMHLAKRACVSYLKCVHLMRDKEVFNLSQIDKDKFAESLGLMNVPQLEFANDTSIQITNTMSRAEQRKSRI
jgi:ATP-dependent RNA helicase DDX10/DBP4